MTSLKEWDYSPQEILIFKNKLYSWSSRKKNVFVLDSNQSQDKYGNFDLAMGIGIHKKLEITTWEKSSFLNIDEWMRDRSNFSFISLNYNLKTVIQKIKNTQKDFFKWPLFYSVIPIVLIKITKEGRIQINSKNENAQQVYLDIINSPTFVPKKPKIKWHHTPLFDTYNKHFKAIKQHLLDGDIYEMNYCHQFKGDISEEYFPLAWFYHFNKIVQKPFSSFISKGNQSVLCFSPERFLRKMGNQIITQPIKGTLPTYRKKANLKEYAENVMIVDLCRNDLAQICQTGSIEVTELIGLYPFKNINHLISSITGKLNDRIDFSQILTACFPMGSMTGAPKDSAIRIIEQEESFSRGLYSGAIGYKDENGDFDFNVVIRTLFLDKKTREAHVPVGGAILYDSTCKNEYDETFQKVKFFSEDFNDPTNLFENQQ